jgi:hypothetical protein
MKLKNQNAVAISLALFGLGLAVMFVVPYKSIMHNFGGGLFLIGVGLSIYFGIHELKK